MSVPDMQVTKHSNLTLIEKATAQPRDIDLASSWILLSLLSFPPSNSNHYFEFSTYRSLVFSSLSNFITYR